MKISIATWNVNSVRAHIDTLQQFLADRQPDILCLQEIKVTNEAFPLELFKANGYVHHALHGQKAYHGVAIFSKKSVPLEKLHAGTGAALNRLVMSIALCQAEWSSTISMCRREVTSQMCGSTTNLNINWIS